MPRRSIQDNIRIKKERETAAALAAYRAGAPVPPPPAPVPLKRKLGPRSALAGHITQGGIPRVNPVIAPYRPRTSIPTAIPAHPSTAAYHTVSPHVPNAYPQPTQAAAHLHQAVPATSDPSHPFHAILHAAPPPVPVHRPHHVPVAPPHNPPAQYAPPAVVPRYESPVLQPKAKKPRKSAAEKAGEAPKEHRPARFRVKAPLSTMERHERVMSQRMFMVDRERYREGETPAERFAVLGSTGNVYRVTIDFNPSCDCPDCQKGNSPCKHIIFVFMKVLKIPTSSTIWYQKGLTNSELKHVFDQAPPSQNDPHIVSAAVRKAYMKATGRGGDEEEEAPVAAGPEQGKPKRAVVGEDCPICYEEMSEADLQSKRLVSDESAGGCGNGLHRECFNMWAMTARGKREKVTCVYCRSEWVDGTGAGGSKGKSAAAGPSYSGMGYLNMADVAGISRQRDTSSYYHGPIAGMRMADIGKRYQND